MLLVNEHELLVAQRICCVNFHARCVTIHLGIIQKDELQADFRMGEASNYTLFVANSILQMGIIRFWMTPSRGYLVA
ncbi:hypothetical protein [Sphingobacterium suaedae]|uniref:Uncharacterized protein n=1 Tax=Sphingobacterium suaedae TaxID=1686402 RepID=A0ABW5KHJ2_9SPHI